MNEQEFKMRMKAQRPELPQGFEARQEAVLLRAMAAPPRRMPVRRGAALLLAAVMLLAVCGAAAVGLGLFGQIRGSKVDEGSYTRLGLLEDAAQSIGKTQRLTIPGTDYGVELTIDQAYCDGRKLYYSYTLKTDASDRYRSYVGDGAELADGTYLTPVDSGDGVTEDGARMAYYEVKLPEEVGAEQAITFELTIITQEEGKMDRAKLLRVPVTVPVASDLTVLRGEGMFGGVLVTARLLVSDVDVAGELLAYAEEWNAPGDVTLMADGVAYRELEGWPTAYDGEKHTMRVRFDLPQGDVAAYTLTCDLESETGGLLTLTEGE